MQQDRMTLKMLVFATLQNEQVASVRGATEVQAYV